MQQTARAFLTMMGLSVDGINCDITYKRTDVAGATFVECHRAWSTHPILNLAGLVNVPENKPLTALAVGMVDEGSKPNPAIVETSTGQDGFERPTDYNSATIVLDQNGEVLMVNSNLRVVEATQALTPASDFVTPEVAWQQIAQGKGTSLTVPAGEGVVDAK